MAFKVEPVAFFGLSVGDHDNAYGDADNFT